MHPFFTTIHRFSGNKSGNVAMMFAIVCVPLISAVGCAVDYSMATRMRAKLQSAADAASVASISQQSPGYLAAAAMTGSGSVTAGVNDANKIFDGNMGDVSDYTNLSRTSTVTKTGVKLASNVQFSADIPVTFMKLVGWQKLTVTGTSSSTSSLPPYLDFYLMLDVSGSMGLPSTAGEQARLAAVNPDNYVQYPTGCTLACHFAPQSACTDSGTQGYPTNNYCLGYAISRVSQSGYTSLLTTKNSNPKKLQLPSSVVSGVPPYTINNGLPNSLTVATAFGGGGLTAVTNCPTDGTDACIQLRLDAVGNAVNQLFITANNTETLSNQFRIGLYPFITDVNTGYFPLTSSINGSPTNPSTINYAAANLASQLDTNANASLGSGGTHVQNALNEMNNTITSVGDGSSPASTQPYVFLVTDGAVDPQMKGLNTGGWSGSNHATVIDPVNTNVCSQLKNRGVIVSVLYIPYQPISPVNSSFANDEDDYANWNIPNIPASLQNCASPGFFYTANAPADITAAMNAMFNHAVVTAHITN